MKNIFISLSTVLLVLVFIGCDVAGGSDPIVEESLVTKLPTLSTGGSSRALIPESLSEDATIYYVQNPLIYGFRSNDGGLDIGDTFIESNPLVGEVVFTISEDGDEIVFTGSSDNDVTCVVRYNPKEDSFTYKQSLYVDDVDGVVFGNDRTEVFVSLSLNNVVLEEDGSFLGDSKSIALFAMDGSPMGMEGTVWGFQSILVGEIFHGTFNDSEEIGTGFSIRECYMGMEGLPNTSGLAPTTGLELTSLATIDDYIAAETYANFTVDTAMKWVDDGNGSGEEVEVAYDPIEESSYSWAIDGEYFFFSNRNEDADGNEYSDFSAGLELSAFNEANPSLAWKALTRITE